MKVITCQVVKKALHMPEMNCQVCLMVIYLLSVVNSPVSLE